MKVIKLNLIDKLASKSKMSKALAKELITSMFDIIFEELVKGNKVALPKIGTLKTVYYKASRMGSLHGDGNVDIPASLRMRLVSSKLMKEAMEELHKIQSMENTTLFE